MEKNTEVGYFFTPQLFYSHLSFLFVNPRCVGDPRHGLSAFGKMESHETASGVPCSEADQRYQGYTPGTTPNLSGGLASSQFLNSQQFTTTQHTYGRRENAFNPMNKITRVVDSTAEQLKADFEAFLVKFQDPLTGKPCYLDQIKSLSRLGITTVYIDFDHVMIWDEIIAKTIASKFHRCVCKRKNAYMSNYRALRTDSFNLSQNGSVSPQAFTEFGPPL